MINKLLKLPGKIKKIIVISIDVVGFFLAFAISKIVLANEEIYLNGGIHFQVLSAFIFIFIAYRLGFYNHFFRYTIFESNSRLIKLFISFYLAINLADYYLSLTLRPFGNFFLTTIFLIEYICVRYIAYWFISNGINDPKNKICVAIYGIDDDSYKVIGMIKQLGIIKVVGIFEDDNRRLGSVLHGVEIYSAERIPEILSKYGVQYLLVNERRKTAINQFVDELVGLKISIKNLPLSKEILSSGLNFKNLDDYKIEELLYRNETDLAGKEINQELIANRSILITGGGGSIGGEIAKQLSLYNPKKLIILDHSEYNLYKIRNEIVSLDENTLITILGSYDDSGLVQELMGLYQPSIIFHAAAYKHVPLLEENVIKCIQNNFLGTVNFLEIVARYGITHFTYISSDKAVRPTNIMGASKRLCEKYIQCMAAIKNEIKFTIVRFGNVLNSSGSVVPLFKSQIKNGGPVTVTHPDITRYFMTLSEAVFLVIQATDISKSGEISLLDMGKPIKILELAKRMIELSGFNPILVLNEAENYSHDSAVSIPIIFSGLRPGEKLYEELLIEQDSIPTAYSKIYTASENYINNTEMQKFISEIKNLIDHRDVSGVLLLVESYAEANFRLKQSPL
ncbi:polysaccharide biosynthesis protein [Polynucleobacter sp. MWH-UH23A]|uniref:polysaccharide biosynthesis protein n=1 Tax=Polynucleobacter sp. MWH-UH23A TaxID=1855613 RepID=UPI003364E3FA